MLTARETLAEKMLPSANPETRMMTKQTLGERLLHSAHPECADVVEKTQLEDLTAEKLDHLLEQLELSEKAQPCSSNSAQTVLSQPITTSEPSEAEKIELFALLESVE